VNGNGYSYGFTCARLFGGSGRPSHPESKEESRGQEGMRKGEGWPVGGERGKRRGEKEGRR